jgi:hypothetical protein
MTAALAALLVLACAVAGCAAGATPLTARDECLHGGGSWLSSGACEHSAGGGGGGGAGGM